MGDQIMESGADLELSEVRANFQRTLKELEERIARLQGVIVSKDDELTTLTRVAQARLSLIRDQEELIRKLQNRPRTPESEL
jgi:hypothetical protein